MPLSQTLAQIPGLGGYLAQKESNDNAGMADVSRAESLMQLLQHVQQQQELQRKSAREEALRQSLGRLDPNATDEDITRAVIPHAGPNDILKTITASKDRKAAAEERAYQFLQNLELKKQDAERKHEEFLAKTTDAQARAAFEQQHKTDMLNFQKMQAQALNSFKQQGLDLQGQLIAQGGKPPPGYRPTKEGNLEAIPGGPADLKLQGVLNQDTATMNNSINSMDRLATAANEVLNSPGLKGITGVRGAIPNIPGSAAADAETKLNTLKSQVAFGVLQEMRNNSKTGGALGAVSDAEGKRLEANLASLEKAQSMKAMVESLKKIIEYTQGAKDRLRAAYNMKHGEKSQATPAAPAAEKKVKRTGMLNGRKVVQYEDGSVEYAD